MVGSEAEYECLAEAGQWGLRVPGLDCAAGLFGGGVNESVMVCLGFGVGGHNGLLVSKIGLDISRLSTEGAREEREERDEREEGPLLPLIESVSLDHEKERSGRVLEAGVFFPGE